MTLKAWPIKYCETCQKAFTTHKQDKTKRFCSWECRAFTRHEIRCKGCGQVVRKTRHDSDDYCSRQCYFDQKQRISAERQALRKIAQAWGNSGELLTYNSLLARLPKHKSLKACVICGKQTRTKSQVCSNTCRYQWAQQPKDMAFVWFNCADCGTRVLKMFKNGLVTPSKAKYCSLRCCQRAAKRQRKYRIRSTRTEYENISRMDIYNRHNGTCGICHEYIDAMLQYPDFASLTLDHIVPLAKGGTHSTDNLQPAHFMCNSLKSDSMPDSVPHTYTGAGHLISDPTLT